MDATVDKDIILAGDLICFPVSHLYFFVGGWGCLDPQTGWGHDWIFLLGSTLNECNREITPQTEPTIDQKDSENQLSSMLQTPNSRETELVLLPYLKRAEILLFAD